MDEIPTGFVNIDLGAEEEEFDELVGMELMSAFAPCGDLVRLEPAMIGSIYPAHREDRVLVRRDRIPQHLVQALLAGLVLILLPLMLSGRRRVGGAGVRAGTYFFLLGLTFLFVEIAFIQKFTLFLSHPLYAVAVVLAGFLVFAGIGSGLSGRLASRAAIWRLVAG